MGILTNAMDDEHFSNQIANPWLKLADDKWNVLTEGLYPTRFDKNTIIYYQGDFLHFAFIVKSGRVRLGYYSDRGEEKGILIAEKNCMFGEAAALPGYPTYYTATAIVDCELYLIPVSRLMTAIRTNSDVAVELIMLMARKMRIYSAQEVELSFTETYTRTCHALLYIADTYGKQTQKGIVLQNKFTHQELANMIHASRVSVANVFSELTRNGVIQKENGYYVIKKLDALYT